MRLYRYSACFIEVTFIVTIHTHWISHQRIESDDFTFAISYNLHIGISIKEKMRHQGLSEDKRCHFRIWLIVNRSIQRMLDCLFYYRSQYTYKYEPAVLQ